MCPIASGQEDIALAAALDAYRQALKPDERLIVLADQARLRRRAAESDLAPQLLSTAALLGLLQGSEDSPWPAISSADQFDDPGSGGPEVDKGRENIALLKPPGPPASATGRQGGSGQTGTRGIPSAVRPGSRQ
jgi:hypothetical protein